MANQQAADVSDGQGPDIALIVGGGPASRPAARNVFAQAGMQVAIAARDPHKPVLQQLERSLGVHRIACDAGDAESVASMFRNVTQKFGRAPIETCDIGSHFPTAFIDSGRI